MSLALQARKHEIIANAMRQIKEGMGLREIAPLNNVDRKTLGKWLIALGDEYTELRQAMIDEMLDDASEQLESADDVFPLAHAREVWKKATWYAEKRDRARYGQDKAITVNIGVGVAMSEALVSDAGQLLDHLRD